ncbi:hypothetical protein DY000_02025207 [Brassica cretica]|uniref:Uncharacterized protein n=1 Tax=Brassica cretica TaxID=69181 RepID=A0ABQ7EH08_BRACR|nr:hypothetical protein DY000_02025207 [Brassica cretica]
MSKDWSQAGPFPTTEVPIIRKGPTTRSGSRVIRAGFAKAVQELLAQEQTGFKQLLIQELADLKLEDTSEPLEAPDSIHSNPPFPIAPIPPVPRSPVRPVQSELENLSQASSSPDPCLQQAM